MKKYYFLDSFSSAFNSLLVFMRYGCSTVLSVCSLIASFEHFLQCGNFDLSPSYGIVFDIRFTSLNKPFHYCFSFCVQLRFGFDYLDGLVLLPEHDRGILRNLLSWLRIFESVPNDLHRVALLRVLCWFDVNNVFRHMIPFRVKPVLPPVFPVIIYHL